MKQTDRVLRVVGAERIGANQLSQPVASVGRRTLVRFHFAQADRHSHPAELKGALGARQSCTDHPDGLAIHSPFQSQFCPALYTNSATLRWISRTSVRPAGAASLPSL